MKIKDLPKSDRPREKLMAKGADNLKDSELFVMGTATIACNGDSHHCLCNGDSHHCLENDVVYFS
jgi:hypothetical protein